MVKVRCSMVISPNGYISKPDGNEDWITSVNWDEFVSNTEKLNNCVIGRTTYDVVTELDEIKTSNKVIVTHDKTLQPKPGYVVTHSPQEAVNYLQQQGIENVYLVGGGGINTSFAEAGLIDEVELIVVPYMIGKGKQVLSPGDFEFPLELSEVKQLSEDRVRLIYKVIKNQSEQ